MRVLTIPGHYPLLIQLRTAQPALTEGRESKQEQKVATNDHHDNLKFDGGRSDEYDSDDGDNDNSHESMKEELTKQMTAKWNKSE